MGLQPTYRWKQREDSGNFYSKISSFVMMLIGEPTQPNLTYEGEGSKQPEFVYSENQQNSYNEFCKIHVDYQVDVTMNSVRFMRITK